MVLHLGSDDSRYSLVELSNDCPSCPICEEDMHNYCYGVSTLSSCNRSKSVCCAFAQRTIPAGVGAARDTIIRLGPKVRESPFGGLLLVQE